jgi:glucose-1-phosphatase
MQPSDGTRDIGVLLFDVGGVLVELRGIETMQRWLGGAVGAEELWRKWLRSESVRGFETGQIDASTFAIGVTREFGLALEPHQFLESFMHWQMGLYPGALEMLARIPNRYRRAILSNSNPLHWPQLQNSVPLGTLFERHFVSHLTGRIKPDVAAFEHVMSVLDCEPREVLFFDDNMLNIEAAAALGMRAIQVRGPLEAQRVLSNLGIINDN